jgi:hypothetical protein
MNSKLIRSINNLSPGAQQYKLGNLFAEAEGIRVRDPQLIRYIAERTGSGDGTARDTAFNNFTDGINWLNDNSDKGAILIVMPGFYIEKASDIPALTANDCLIMGLDLPEQTVLFGSGENGSVVEATDDLLKIKGGRNHIYGLGLYVHKDTKSCIQFDDTGGGYAGSFNRVEGCYFSPQAQDGMGYGIKYLGGNANQIVNNIFYGTKEAAIHMGSQIGNPVRNIIADNEFVGTHIGVNIDAANYNTHIKNNLFSEGTQAGEDMTNAIVVTASMSAGKIFVAQNIFEQTTANDISDSKTGGDVIEIDNKNGV